MAKQKSRALTVDQRRELLSTTREAAAAFAEDVEHFREVLQKEETSRGEIRRLSATVRRLLVERDLATVAAPRLGRVMLVAPDNSEPYRFSRLTKVDFFGSAGVPIFGYQLRGLSVHPGLPRLAFNPEITVVLRFDNFVAQNIICFRGEWISRQAVIKYLANIASGVHSGSVKENEQRIISAVRRFATYSIEPGKANITINMNDMNATDTAFRYEGKAIDPVLVELLATMHFLSISDDVKKLENGIRQELASDNPADQFWPSLPT